MFRKFRSMSSNRTRWAAAAFLAAMMSAGPATAKVPSTMHFQSYLTDPSGAPVFDTVEFTFRMYDGASPQAALLYSEDREIEVEYGLLSVSVGSETPLDMDVFDDAENLYIEIEINGEVLGPRHRVNAVPYALRAANALSVEQIRDALVNQLAPRTCTEGQTVQQRADGTWGCADAGGQGPPGENGAEGPRGPTGPAGETGPQGEPGLAGNDGARGEVGPAGPPGPQGSSGPAGSQGPVGSMGPEGPAGPMGPQGPDGPTGPQGGPGAMGPAGPLGPAGPMGPSGSMGPAGPTGLDGAAGAQGPAGPAGAQGPTGPMGPTGPSGATGAFGGGSAGALTISTSTDWRSVTPTDGDFQFTDVVINAGTTLTVPSGIVIRCTGTLSNAGTIVVDYGMRGARWGGNSDPFPVLRGHGMTGAQGGGGLAFPVSRLRHVFDLGPFGGGNGARGNGSPDNDGGAGAGSIVIRALGGITNSGTITADGGNGMPGDGNDDGGGGGGGGFIILATDGNISNTGTINARGGNGANGDSGECGGGGGGGGVLHLISPNANAVGGTFNLGGGTAGSGVCSCCGGPAGGAMGGNGGRGSDDNIASSAGGTGVVIRTQATSVGSLFL